MDPAYKVVWPNAEFSTPYIDKLVTVRKLGEGFPCVERVVCVHHAGETAQVSTRISP